MFLIYDSTINRHVGITDTNFDVTQICSTYSLVEWTQEGQGDFDAYKQALADANPQPVVIEEIPDAVIVEELTIPTESQQETE